MNLWLCEHVDLKLMGELSENECLNILVHGGALSKYRASPRSTSVSPLHWLNENYLQKYSAEKLNWGRHSRVANLQSLATLCDDTNQFGVDSMFAGVIERLFFPCNQGCLDALAFALSHPGFQEGVRTKLHVIVGENYRLTELAGLVWWLAVCNWRFGASGVDFIWVSRSARAVHVEGVEKLLSLLSTNSSANTSVDGFIPETIRMGKEPVCLAWVGALRYPSGWGEEVLRRIGEPMAILRVAERNCGFYHESPCIELSVGNGVSQEAVNLMYQSAYSALSLAWKSSSDNECFIFDRLGFAIEKYFLTGVAPFVLHQLAQAVDRLEQHIGFIDIKAFYSTTAPFIESIALHEWARRRNVLPVLLPHSWTSSHEFPAVTYRTSLTFVSSNSIMPSFHDDPGSLAKEEVVSLEAIFSQNSLNSKRQTVEISKKYKQFKLLLSIPFSQCWRILLIYIKQVIAAPFIRWYFKQRIGKARLKVGYLLNYEHFEFNAGINFDDLFRFIADIARKLVDLSSEDDAVLVLRRKVGWTNVHLLKWHMRVVQKDRCPNNLVISPAGMTLEEFGALCDVVLYFQGTSAVPELMSLGVPIVLLTDSSYPIMLDEPYIVLPEEIVPRMNIKDIIAHLKREPQWLAELSKLQRGWILTQMAPVSLNKALS
jgi:hypothetical protein